MALTHLQVVVVVGVHRAFWVLNRDCYGVRALSWEEQQSFLSASIELSREFWKVFSGLSCLSVFSSLFACGLLWSLGNDPFYLLNVRLPTAPLLPTQRDSCMPSIVCSLLWAFAVIVCMFDQSAYTKVTRPLQNTHNCIKIARWGEQLHWYTHKCNTWKSALPVVLLHYLVLSLWPCCNEPCYDTESLS